ncbi:MAG TPA: tetratricopeptide repeat protein [Candidatus Binatia bacterium]|nr:tetratricopeptide repeat protein [Candidatus Binatia bacterium]
MKRSPLSQGARLATAAAVALSVAAVRPAAAPAEAAPPSAEAARATAPSAPPADAAAVSPTSGDPAADFERANAAFADGRFAEAADLFAAIAAHAGASPGVLFNLGNASFRAGRIGEAVLAYERALLLAPRASEIAANLRQVRRAANLADPEAGLWPRTVALATADGWAWLASACLTLACVGLLCATGLRSRLAGRPGVQRALRAAIAVLVAGLVLASAAAASAIAELDRGVVVGRDPTLRVAPYPSATTSRPVAPGEVVRIEREHAGFALVRTDDGRTGWLAADQVPRIGDFSKIR